MTIAEAEDIADEQVAWWKGRGHRRVAARQAWHLIRPELRYPGGGWERVRAEVIAVSLEMDAPAELRRAA